MGRNAWDFLAGDVTRYIRGVTSGGVRRDGSKERDFRAICGPCASPEAPKIFFFTTNIEIHIGFVCLWCEALHCLPAPIWSYVQIRVDLSLNFQQFPVIT